MFSLLNRSANFLSFSYPVVAKMLSGLRFRANAQAIEPVVSWLVVKTNQAAIPKLHGGFKS